MKVGIVSDPHGNIYGLKAALKAMGPVDALICAGDVVGYYYWVNEVFEVLKERRAHLIAGNHDVCLLRYLGHSEPRLSKEEESRILPEPQYRERYGAALDEIKPTIKPEYLDWLKRAGVARDLELGGLKIGVFHGSPWNPLDEYVYPDSDSWDRFASLKYNVVIMGHTHYPIVKKVSDVLVINPGSCGQPRDYDPRAAYAVLDTDRRSAEVGRMAYEVDRVVAEVKRREPANSKSADILTRTRALPKTGVQCSC